jgi:DNA-binding response OmpR family regulator
VRASLLIADDEHAVANSIAEVMRDEGFDVAVAYNGTSALDIALKTSPQIILCDIQMPHLSGLEVLQEVRQRGLDASFILMSSVPVDLPSLGVPFIMKPFNLDSLIKLINSLAADAASTSVSKSGSSHPS